MFVFPKTLLAAAAATLLNDQDQEDRCSTDAGTEGQETSAAAGGDATELTHGSAEAGDESATGAGASTLAALDDSALKVQLPGGAIMHARVLLWMLRAHTRAAWRSAAGRISPMSLALREARAGLRRVVTAHGLQYNVQLREYFTLYKSSACPALVSLHRWG